MMTDFSKQQGVLERTIEYGSDEAIAMGARPYEAVYPDTIPRDEWHDRIEEMRANEAMPSQKWYKNKVPKKSQNGFNFCWNFSLASWLEMTRLQQGLEYVRLSGTCLGELVNWRNRGYYLMQALNYAMKNGLCEERFASDKTINPRNFDPQWKENRGLYLPLEYTDTRTVDQKVSLVLRGEAGYIAYDWWRHALCAAGLRNAPEKKYGLEWEVINSHNDGIIILDGDRGVPDEFYGGGSCTT
jgi:hypothetical protein